MGNTKSGQGGMQRVFVFPGQGSQSIGMMAGLAAQDRVVADTFAEVSAVVGEDLWKLVCEGPVERLAETTRTQPVMLAAGLQRGAAGATPAATCGCRRQTSLENSHATAAGAGTGRSGPARKAVRS
jgi:malonyl CoA-acyl carrier protein transacylase